MSFALERTVREVQIGLLRSDYFTRGGLLTVGLHSAAHFPALTRRRH